eukprot:3600985-Rhodomonas_salina.1
MPPSLSGMLAPHASTLRSDSRPRLSTWSSGPGGHGASGSTGSVAGARADHPTRHAPLATETWAWAPTKSRGRPEAGPGATGGEP